MDWLPIETAPKDGTVFITYWGDMPCFCAYVDYPAQYRDREVPYITGRWPFKKKEYRTERVLSREAEIGFRVLVNGREGNLYVHGNFPPFTPKIWMPLPLKESA